jgi:mannan endo-1,4-beta-mannosidase
MDLYEITVIWNAQLPTFDENEEAASVQFDLLNTGNGSDGSSKESFELAINPEKLNMTGYDQRKG